MNHLVKFIIDDDGEKHTSHKWHLVVTSAGESECLCTSEVFGYGVSQAQYETKDSERGITCPECRDFIRKMKSVKL